MGPFENMDWSKMLNIVTEFGGKTEPDGPSKFTNAMTNDDGQSSNFANIAMVGSKAFSGMMGDADPEAQKWGLSEGPADQMIDNAIGMIPGWGTAAVIAKNVLNGAASSAFDYNERGLDEKGGSGFGKDLAYGAQTLLNPISAVSSLNDQKSKTGKDLQWYDNFTGKNRDKIQDTAKGRESIFNDLESMNKEYEKSQNKFLTQTTDYNNNIAESNRRYSGNILIGKNGGILNPSVIKIDVISKVFDHYNRDSKQYYSSEIEVISFKEGGSLNIIPMGAYHHTENNLGDKGLPVVDNGVKIFEIERDELILNRKASLRVKFLQQEYNKTGDEKHLDEIGDIMKEQVLRNTKSKSPIYNCLNSGTCKLKN